MIANSVIKCKNIHLFQMLSNGNTFEENMFYTTSGSHKKAKMIIDYSNIVLTVCVAALFIIILFMRSKSGVAFPLIFAAGATVNFLTGIKKFMDRAMVSGIILMIVTGVLLIMSVLCLGALQR